MTIGGNVAKKELKTLLGRDLPYNLDAEKLILTACLINEECFDQVCAVLIADDFYFKPHKIIYQAVCALYKDHKGADLVLLHDYLQAKNLSEECGGINYLIELQEALPAIGLVEHYCRLIKDKALLRQLILLSSQIISLGYETQGRTVGELLDYAESKLFQLSHHVANKDFVQLSSLLKQSFKRLSEISESQGSITGLPTGFHSFDVLTSGMQAGDLLILAARPAMGKTALALNIALNAWRSGGGVGIFSLEMPSDQLVLRMIAAESGIAHHKIRTGSISSEEWLELTHTAAVLDEAQIFIDDSPSVSIMELRAKARRLKLKYDIKLLVIDYLQLITVDQKSENRTQEISLISRSLKALAKELGIPILALSQLSRSLEARMDKRPLLSDLRESGAIEQDADVVFFIYRDVVYNAETEHPDSAEIIIGKQRNGPIGTVYVRYEGQLTKFVEPVPKEGY